MWLFTTSEQNGCTETDFEIVKIDCANLISLVARCVCKPQVLESCLVNNQEDKSEFTTVRKGTDNHSNIFAKNNHRKVYKYQRKEIKLEKDR